MPKREFNINEMPPPDADFEALFGKDLDIDDADAEEILATYGIDTEQAVAQFKTCLQDRIRELAGENAESEQLESLQHFVRDISNYQRARSPESVEPNGWVRSILDGTNASSFPSHTAFAFRKGNADGASEDDQQLLNEIEDELNKED